MRSAWNAVRGFSTTSRPPPVAHRVRSTSPAFQRLLTLHLLPTSSSPPASLLVEGRTLIQHLASSPWQLANLVLTQHTIDKELERQKSGEPHLCQLIPCSSTPHTPQLLQLTSPLLRRLSYAMTPSEYMAEFTLPAAASSVSSPLTATIMVDGVSDPTNLGSLLRSAHAFGFRQLIVRPGSCSPYSRKVVAGSAGSIAYMQVREWDERLEAELQASKTQGTVYVIGLVASGGRPMRAVADRARRRRAQGTAVWLVVGNESRGLTSEMVQWCDELCTIPMSSEVESLNVAVAASIACYELGGDTQPRGVQDTAG